MDATASLTPQALLHRLEWRVVRRLDGLLQGDYRTLFRGAGIDFTDLREYTPGDDLRHVDWNVTARMDTPYVREYVEDREVTAWLLLDHSASMGFGPVDRQKDLVLAETATTLAHVLSRGGNRVGMMLLGDEPGVIDEVIPPGGGRRQVLRIAGALLAQRAARAAATDIRATQADARGRRTRAPGGGTDLGALLRAGTALVRRRSLVVVVSDFISSPGWERPLAQLAQRHDVVAIRVVDPRESELPSAGMVYVEDAETGEQIFVDTCDPAFRARLLEAAAARDEELLSATRAAGVTLHRVGTDEDLVRTLVRICSLRARAATSRRAG
ncbi:DUF58 domain-containing protein [Dermatophilaceae bacterium Soc4.6]